MPPADPIKVYDARWEIHEFDDDAIRRLFEATLAYGQRHGVDTLALTRDARLHGPRVMEIALEVALQAGFHVFICPDPVSTPQSYFFTLHVSQTHPATMGLTITASHNPRDYIGVKFTMPVVQAIGLDCGPEGGLTQIKAFYRDHQRPARADRRGHLTMMNLGQQYIDYSLQQAGVEKGSLAGLRVVLDCFHGAAGPEMLEALEQAGVEVEPLRLIPDGRFPTGSPNPTSQHKMEHARHVAVERDCLLAIGLDGDGDRIVVSDQVGVFSAGFVAIPVLRAWRKQAQHEGQTPVLFDPKVNPLALREWGTLNLKPMLYRNGHSQIKHFMMQYGAIAAAEESGHYYHRLQLGSHTIACENAVLTTLLLLEAIKQDPTLADDLRQYQDTISTTGEFNYQFDTDQQRDDAWKAIVSYFEKTEADMRTEAGDGTCLQGTLVSRGVQIKETSVVLQDGWFSSYFRPSTTERSILRSYCSSAEPHITAELEQQLKRIIVDGYGGRPID